MKSKFKLLLSRKSSTVSIGFENGGFVSNDVYPVLTITPINRLRIAQLKERTFVHFPYTRSSASDPKSRCFIE